MDYPYRTMNMEMDMDSHEVNQTEGSCYHIIPISYIEQECLHGVLDMLLERSKIS
jgi:hypothetical protein